MKSGQKGYRRSMNALIDTNVILDAIEVRQGFFDDSSEVISSITKYKGFIAASNVTDIYYIEHRRNHSKKKTIELMKRLFEIFDILDTTAEDCRNALRSDIADYEDAVLVESARRNDISCIVTRNTKDFKTSGIPVYTPVEFLQLLRSKRKGETYEKEKD